MKSQQSAAGCEVLSCTGSVTSLTLRSMMATASGRPFVTLARSERAAGTGDSTLLEKVQLDPK